MTQQWEYHVWFLDTTGAAASIRDNLNEHGRDGWELVGVAPYDFDPEISGQQLVGFFKRPKVSEPDYDDDSPPEIL